MSKAIRMQSADTMSSYNNVGNSTDQFSGNDFSNNLFTDLAPLLALFGETVTKQYLSITMGWEDCVLLAVGPSVFSQ
jgi:hypothetical protein